MYRSCFGPCTFTVEHISDGSFFPSLPLFGFDGWVLAVKTGAIFRVGYAAGSAQGIGGSPARADEMQVMTVADSRGVWS